MRLHKNTFHCLHQAETLLFFIELTVLKVKYRSSTPPSTQDYSHREKANDNIVALNEIIRGLCWLMPHLQLQ